MSERVLTRRELNRATLARQLLLERAALPILDAIERVVGLQAETTKAPYIGLWTRVKQFQRDDLTQRIAERQVVRATLMRSTLHLCTASDYVQLRPALQPALTRALYAFYGKKARMLDVEQLVADAQPYLEASARTLRDLRATLGERYPQHDAETMTYAVRTRVPMVQVSPGGVWGTGGSPVYALAQRWLNQPLTGSTEPRALILRYLAAFGPATVRDIQTWSGLVRLQDHVAALKPELRTFRDERGNELVDLPDAPLPPADTFALPRFLPEFDNLILAHADRTRVLADEHRSRVFLSAGRVRATFLLDGFVRGTWKIERVKTEATLVIESFTALTSGERAAIGEEGERLVRFVEDDAERVDVQFASEG